MNARVAAVSFCLFAWLCAPSFAAGKKGEPVITIIPNTKPIEVVGEVVDAWCCASKTVGIGRGPEHKQCAETCIRGGVSAGIIDDKGNLYIAAKTRAYEGANRMLLPFVAKRVWVKGSLSEAGGTKLIKIAEIKEWKPGMKVGKAALPPPPKPFNGMHVSEDFKKAVAGKK